MTEEKRLGDWGEAEVAAYLAGRGYTILARNWRCRYGELDIVARQGQVLAIVEVKTRRSNRYMFPREAVDYRKRQRLLRAGEAWLAAHPEEDGAVRFDVAEVYPAPEGRSRIQYLEDAFQ